MRLIPVSLALALLLMPFPDYAQITDFPCASFRLQANGTLEVVEPVTLKTSTGQTLIMHPGTRIGPGIMMGSIDVYEAHRRNCR